MRAYEGEWVASAILEDRAEKLGDHTFVTATNGSLTYAELAQAAARVAGALKERGVQPGDRVATMLPERDRVPEGVVGDRLGGSRRRARQQRLQGRVPRPRGRRIGREGLRHRPPVARAGGALRGHPRRPAGTRLRPHQPDAAPRARPALHHVHVRHDRPGQGRDARQPLRALERRRVAGDPRPHAHGHRLFDVPALPRHGPQRGGDGDDVGRRQGPPRRRIQRHPLLG